MFLDCRSKKIALLSNCILNQNAKVAHVARWPGITPGIVELLQKYDFGIQQMPCPEVYTVGIRRFWACYEQYNGRGMNRAFGEVINFLLDEIHDFLSHGFKAVMIGVNGSCSCGVTITDKDLENTWLGPPCLPKEINSTDYPYDDGMGVYIEMIQRMLKERGFDPLPAYGLSLGLGLMGEDNNTLDLRPLEEFLKANS